MDSFLQSFYTIRFNDCDPFWHLNNSCYLDYFLNAREDHLREYYQFELSEEYKKGNGWLIYTHQIAYLRPANYNETVWIRSGILGYSREILNVEMVMLDKAGKQLKSILHTQFVPVSIATGKKEAHTEEFMTFLQGKEIQGLDPQRLSLTDRIGFWTQVLKQPA